VVGAGAGGTRSEPGLIASDPDNQRMLKTDSPSAAVRLLTLDRPDDLNAMTAELCGALHDELDRIAADRSCRAVVLTGAGRAFCVGLDLKGYGEAPGNDGTDNARDRLGNQEHMSRLILKLRETPQPVIAAVNGPAADSAWRWRSAATSATPRPKRSSARSS
jgi:enoyl-CoA hydratase/carnithine racemase